MRRFCFYNPLSLFRAEIQSHYILQEAGHNNNIPAPHNTIHRAEQTEAICALAQSRTRLKNTYIFICIALASLCVIVGKFHVPYYQSSLSMQNFSCECNAGNIISLVKSFDSLCQVSKLICGLSQNHF